MKPENDTVTATDPANDEAKCSAICQVASPIKKERVLVKRHKPPLVVEQALVEYSAGHKTKEAIARKFGVSISTLTVWAKKKGVPLRKRGRRATGAPSAKIAQMVSWARNHTQVDAARKFGASRPSVCQALKRWEHWTPQAFLVEPHCDLPSACLSPSILGSGSSKPINGTFAVRFDWTQVNWELRNAAIAGIWGKNKLTVRQMRCRHQFGKAVKCEPGELEEKLAAEKAKAKAFAI